MTGDESFAGTERFEVVRKVGVGSSGVVYEVVDRETGGPLALKTLRSPDPFAVARLKREFRVLSGLTHDHLVHLHGLHELDGLCFITMQYVAGTDAITWVEQAEDRVAAALALAPQLLSALSFLHAQGRLHLDVKPSNVLVRPSGHLLLSDFGLSRALRPGLPGAPAVRRWGGTLAYMAPEQLELRPLGPATDWYAFAATLYELLTGSLPFTGTYSRILEAKTRSFPAIPIGRLVPDLPRELAALIDSLLAPDPTERPDEERIAEVLGVQVRPERSSPYGQGIVGRVEELRQLREHAGAARRTGFRIVELRGISGIGKSTILRAFLESQRTGSPVLAGACFEREWVPFNAFDHAVTNFVQRISVIPAAARARFVPHRAAELVRIFPAFSHLDEFAAAADRPRREGSAGLRIEAFAALAEVLAEFAEGRLLILAIDDVQWADRDSEALLSYLAASEVLRPLLIVVARRVGQDQPPPRPSAAVQVIEVGPLDPESARTLATRAAGVGAPISSILEEADGVPLWLEALGLRSRGGVETEGASLDLLLADAVGALGPDARTMLEALVVAARPTPGALLMDALDVDSPVRALDELRQAGLAVSLPSPSGPTYSLRHARVRERVDALLAPERRATLAGHLAEALLRHRGDSEEIARYLFAASEPLRASQYAILAGRRAASSLAFDRAARLLTVAVEFVPTEEQAALLEELGDVYANDARADAAAQAYLSAARSTDEADHRLRLRHLGAEQLMRSGRIDEGRVLLEELLIAEGLSLPSTPVRALLSLAWRRLRLRLRGTGFSVTPAEELDPTRLTRIDAAWSAAATLALVDAVTAASFQARGLLEALELGEPERVARSLGAEAVFRAAFGDHDSARTLWEQTRQVVELVPTPSALAGLATSESVSAYQRGAWQTCHRAATEALEHLAGQRLNLSWARSTAVIYRLAAAGHLGRLEEVRQELPRELEHAHARGDLHAVLHLTLGMPIPLAAIVDEARDGLAQAEQVWSSSPGREYDQLRIHLLRTQGELSLYLGEVEAARAAGNESWTLVSGSPSRRLPIIRLWACELNVRGSLASLGAQGPNLPRAEHRAARRGIQILLRAPDPWARAVGSLAAAQLTLLEGERAAALQQFGVAAEALAATGMALHAAVARLRRAQLLGADAGALASREALDWIRVSGAKDALRIAAMIAPVLPAGEGANDAERAGPV